MRGPTSEAGDFPAKKKEAEVWENCLDHAWHEDVDSRREWRRRGGGH